MNRDRWQTVCAVRVMNSGLVLQVERGTSADRWHWQVHRGDPHTYCRLAGGVAKTIQQAKVAATLSAIHGAKS